MDKKDEEQAIRETIKKISAVLIAAEKVGEEIKKEKGK